MNRCIFELKREMGMLESILREEKKIDHRASSRFERWIRSKFGDEEGELFHRQADPLLFFNIMEEMLQLLHQDRPSEDSEAEEIRQNEEENNETEHPTMLVHQEYDQMEVSEQQLRLRMVESEEPLAKSQPTLFRQLSTGVSRRSDQLGDSRKWLNEASDVYFLKKKRKENLHLNLQRAKLLQATINLKQSSKEQPPKPPLENLKLLKESYVDLIAEHQRLKKQLSSYQKYIDELEGRNELLAERAMAREPPADAPTL